MFRTRPLRLLLAALLVLAAVPAAPAVAAGDDGTFVLATEAGGQGGEQTGETGGETGGQTGGETGGETGELPGPEPDPQTSFAPKDYEPPWTWWLGVILTVVAVLAVGGTALGYYLLVRRPTDTRR
jgi:hypothetical protein